MEAKKTIRNTLASFWLKHESDIIQVVLALILIVYFFLNRFFGLT